MDRVNIIGANISVTNMDDCIKFVCDNLDKARGNYICVSNVHTTVMANEDADYRNIQNNSFMTLPDGKPLSVIGRKRGYANMDRVTGPEFMEHIMAISGEYGWKHYIYGNTKENIDILVKYLRQAYPDAEIVGYAPSVFRSLTNEEEDELIKRINDSGADFVWVGLGAPRQEIFCAKHSRRTNSIWIGVGGAFNVIAGIIPRAPQWMQKCSLEWLYRLIKEPRRLFKRYLITNTKFIYRLNKASANK